jgi:membrane fusion protein (multidrug efflux system)
MTPDEAYEDRDPPTSYADPGQSRSRHEPRQEKRTHQERASEDHPGSGDRQSKPAKNGKPKKNIFQSRKFRIGALVVLALLIIGGIIWWLIARHYESTDDAFVDAHVVQVSPQTSGQVVRVDVTDNQHVAAGEPLVEIDAADARARLQQIQAQETQAETQYRQAIASAAGADAQWVNAQRELERYRTLQRTLPAAVARQQIDQAEATAKNLAAQREVAQAQIAGAAAQMKVYQAQISAAQLTLGYTHVVAPVEGTIAQRTVAVGNYVSPGQQMMAIVPMQIWITANFKETQLAHMRIGQKATIRIDACAGAKALGHVDSIQRGAGQAFAILPPENATGNYVKVVQRVPVKLVLDRIPDGCIVGPGMSVVPKVKVR